LGAWLDSDALRSLLAKRTSLLEDTGTANVIEGASTEPSPQDMVTEIITVSVRPGKVYAIGEPKTKNSRRVIRLTAAAVEALRGHLSSQLEEMERMGSLYRPGGLVFATEAGTIVNPSNVRNRSLKPLLKAAGLRPVRFHDLRHTCATLLLSKNVNPKIVSEMLGHASVSITLDVYSHLMPDMQEKAAQALEEALG